MSPYYDALEIRDVEERMAHQFELLRDVLAQTLDQSPYYGELLAEFAGLREIDAATLARMPLTRKSDLQSLQQEQPPFGRLAHLSPPTLTRLFASPGPIYEPETRRKDCWRFARALYAAGIRSGDLLHNCFLQRYSFQYKY